MSSDPTKTGVKYIGNDTPFVDALYGSGLKFMPDQTRLVEPELAAKLTRHAEFVDDDTFDYVTATTNLTGGSDFSGDVSTLKLPAGVTDLTGGVGSSIANTLITSRQLAYGRNPVHTYGQTQPLVASVVLDGSAFATTKTHSYFDADGAQRFRIIGLPEGDQSLFVVPSGQFVYPKLVNGVDAATNTKGYYVEAVVDCEKMQWNVKGFNLSSNYFALYVNGVKVPFTAGAVNNNIQITFSARGKYTVGISIHGSLTVSGITVLEDDTVFHQLDYKLPVVISGDSYTTGTLSPQTLGVPTMLGSLSMIGGINAIGRGVSGCGYANPGASTSPLNSLDRITDYVAALNYTESPLFVMTGGLNDIGGPYTESAIKAAAKDIINAVLEQAAVKIMVFGTFPANTNQSAGVLKVDAALSAAVAEIASTRCVFIATSKWISGTRSTGSTTGGVAGNSRWFTGSDNVHPSPIELGNGAGYLADKINVAMIDAAKEMGW